MAPESVFDASASRKLEAAYLTPDVVEQRRATLDALALCPGERVLDVGSGPGLLVAEMAQAVGPAGHVTGLDVSDAMLALGQRRWVELTGAGRASLIKADATALPFAGASFDVAVSTQVYEYVTDLPTALAELHGVLRPGGRTLILDTDWDSIVWHATDAKQMGRLLAAWMERFADPTCPAPPAPRRRLPGRPAGRAGAAQPRVRPQHLQHRQRPDHGRLRRHLGPAHMRRSQCVEPGSLPARGGRAVLLQPQPLPLPRAPLIPTSTAPGTNCEQFSRCEPRSPTAPRVEGSGRAVVACPTTSGKPANQPGF